MFLNNCKMNKQDLDKVLPTAWMEKSESDVLDDMFLAIQNIVAGTATVSNTVLSETCFQYKIHLSEESPLITLQYELKLKKELSPMMPVVKHEEIGENSRMCQSPNSKHNSFEDTSKDTYPVNSVQKEVPELLSVLNNIEVIKDEELVSAGCSQDNSPTVIHFETNNCNKSTSEYINQCDIAEYIAVSLDDPDMRNSVTEDGNCEYATQFKRYDRIVKKNGINKDEKIIDLVNEKKYSCSYCGKLFKWKSTKQLHETVHTNEKPFGCELCNKSFSRLEMLIDHKKMHTGDKSWKCEECGKCFKYLSQLMVHRCDHTVEKPFTCEECGKGYFYSFQLNDHKRVHTGEKPFKCEKCGKCFTQIGYLNAHKRIHTCRKPFTCEECGKSFTQIGNLTTHRRFHTGETPFTCEECGKGFLSSRNLIDHKRVHTGEKPFKCEDCGKCFTQIGNLAIHKKIHTGAKPFTCEICNKSFSRSHVLIDHKRIHTGEKPFKCEECGKYFAWIGNLKTHKKIHTGDKTF